MGWGGQRRTNGHQSTAETLIASVLNYGCRVFGGEGLAAILDSRLQSTAMPCYTQISMFYRCITHAVPDLFFTQRIEFKCQL